VSQRVVVSGGTGYVGSALVSRLAAEGREVVVLSRSQHLPSELAALSSVRARVWDARSPDAIVDALDGAAAVVHLAGARAVAVRFTRRRKKLILESRVKSAEALVAAIERCARRPSVVVSASGVDYYGAHPSDEACDESTPAGGEFLSRVCVEWEGAARAAERLGVRVATARFGVVLGPGKGPLRLMALPFRFFVGGPLGSGRQIFPWVHLDDALAALELCVQDPALTGPVNITAPGAVTQRELARALGRALHRPSFFPVPAFLLELLFGEGARPIVTGKRVVPQRLLTAGFRFRHPEIDGALADALR
jgi:uncharacterized protein (TIGR01777 family)